MRFAFVILSLTLALPAVAREGHDAKSYKRCPGQELLNKLTDLDWASGKSSALTSHRAFRAKLGAPMPEGPSRVLLYGSGGDLETLTFSIVAVRSAGGVWHVDAVGENQVWIDGRPADRIPSISRDLTANEGERLDAMIADPCLLEGPTFQRNPNIIAGALYGTLEVEKSGNRWIGTWLGGPTAQEQAIVDLLGTR